jgi:3-hydroxybutyryl-CoA dehydrogenase
MTGFDGPVLVVGGGTMGLGIAQVLLDADASVALVEPDEAVRSSVLDRLGAHEGFVAHASVPGRVDAALVVEAVPESLVLKRDVLTIVESAVSTECVLATNTSSLSISSIGAALVRPERVIGMHFFNPVPKSLLVEIVRGDRTSDSTIASAQGWVERIGKEHIEVRDTPGFATSRLGVAIGLEAIRMVEEGVASVEDIDRGMVLGYRFPVGPLRLTDLVGLDVRLAIAEHLAATLGPSFQPPLLLREKVANGELGRKSGKGFYSWS